MTRAILYLIVFVLVIGVARSVLGIISKGFADLINPAASSPVSPPRVPTTEALKKDPVCGTFIGASTALQKTIGGTTYYFCSAECRDKFGG